VHRCTLYRKRKATAATPATGPGVFGYSEAGSGVPCRRLPSPLRYTGGDQMSELFFGARRRHLIRAAIPHPI